MLFFYSIFEEKKKNRKKNLNRKKWQKNVDRWKKYLELVFKYL